MNTALSQLLQLLLLLVLLLVAMLLLQKTQKSEYDVVLKDAGAQKVAVIKAVKDIPVLVLVKQRLSLTVLQRLSSKRLLKKTLKHQESPRRGWRNCRTYA